MGCRFAWAVPHRGHSSLPCRVTDAERRAQVVIRSDGTDVDATQNDVRTAQFPVDWTTRDHAWWHGSSSRGNGVAGFVPVRLHDGQDGRSGRGDDWLHLNVHSAVTHRLHDGLHLNVHSAVSIVLASLTCARSATGSSTKVSIMS